MRSAIAIKILNYTWLSMFLGGCVSLQETSLINNSAFSMPVDKSQNFQSIELPSPELNSDSASPKLTKFIDSYERKNFFVTEDKYIFDLSSLQDNDLPLPNLNHVSESSPFGIIGEVEEGTSEYFSQHIQSIPVVVEIAYQLPTPLFVGITNIEKQGVSPEEEIIEADFVNEKEDVEISVKPISLENKRSISVDVNERFELSFEGEGWIYLGDFSTSSPGNIQFIFRSVVTGETQFQFIAVNRGNYQLEFQLQNFRTGVDMKEIVYLEASIPNLETAAMDSIESVEVDTKHLQKNYHQLINITDELLENGLVEEALSAYLSVYEEGDFEMNQRIAESYFSLGEIEKANDYWQKNLELSFESEKKTKLVMMDASLNLLKVAVIKEDISEVKRLHSVLLSDFEIDIKNITELYFEVGNFLFAKGHIGEALDVFWKFVDLFQNSKLLPEVYFQLANALEFPSIHSDLIASRQYYQRVIKEYPASNFAEQADKRIKYLDQYFFKVR